jgi:hypothetical protein
MIMGILDFICIVVLVVDFIFFYTRTGSYLNDVMYFIIFAISIIYIVMRFYMYQLMITFDLSIKKILKNSLIFTVLGIKRNVLALLGIVLLVTPVVLLCFYKRIQSRGIRIVLLGHFIVSFFILFAVTFGNLGGANWRLTPMLGTSVIVSFLAAVEMMRHREVEARIPARLVGIVLAIMMICSGITAYNVVSIPADYGRDNNWHKVAAELEARGLKYGYGQFWWANAVTLLSDGAVEMSSADSDPTKGLVKSLYQMPTDAYDDKDTDRYFVMFNEKDNSRMSAWIQHRIETGVIIDSFTVESEPYNLSRYGIYGSVVYIYVFNENPF